MVDLTYGELLFYGGITGVVIVLIVSIIVIAILSRSRKKLRNKFKDEYGNK